MHFEVIYAHLCVFYMCAQETFRIPDNKMKDVWVFTIIYIYIKKKNMWTNRFELQLLNAIYLYFIEININDKTTWIFSVIKLLKFFKKYFRLYVIEGKISLKR